MSKRTVVAVLGAFLGLFVLASSTAAAGPPTQCTTIIDGGIMDSAGNPLTLGFDKFGYNYQAHEFNGTYDSADRVLDNSYFGTTGDYVDDHLWMKWSDDWLSNKDCNGDHKLDRGAPGSEGYANLSRGWLTNLVEGDYDSDDNDSQDAHFTDFVKIVWVGSSGSLWGEFQVIQEVFNDPTGGLHGTLAKMPAPGFGLKDHWTQQ